MAGAVIAALISTLGPYLLNKFGGQGTPAQQTGFLQNFDPQRQRLFDQWTQQVGQNNLAQNPLYQGAVGNLQSSPYAKPFDPSQYNQYFQQGVADPAMKQYNEQILPSIKSKYHSPHGIYGSALNQAINQSASDLSGNLNSLRANYLGQSQQQHGAGQLQHVLQQLSLAQAPMNQQAGLVNSVLGAGNVTPMVEEPQAGGLSQFKDLFGPLSQMFPNLNWSDFSNLFGGNTPTMSGNPGGIASYVGGNTPAPSNSSGFNYQPYQPPQRY